MVSDNFPPVADQIVVGMRVTPNQAEVIKLGVEARGGQYFLALAALKALDESEYLKSFDNWMAEGGKAKESTWLPRLRSKKVAYMRMSFEMVARCMELTKLSQGRAVKAVLGWYLETQVEETKPKEEWPE